MKRRKSSLVSIVVAVLIVIESLFVYLTYKSFDSKETNIDNVELLERVDITKTNMFAIMLEQEDGTYAESTSTSWPTDMLYNTEKSGCIDNNGASLSGVLTYDSTSHAATVTTDKTAYCYLYFDAAPDDLNDLCGEYTSVSECLTNESGNVSLISDLWDSTLEDDGIRYVGTSPNNYICFGTTDKTTCTGDTDKYMYRIIGFFEDSSGVQHMKLIKKEALNTSYAWNAVYNTPVDWDASDVYKGINGDYFLDDTTNYPYMAETTWTDKIATWDYTATNTKTYENYNSTTGTPYGPYYYYTSVRAIYLHELNRSGKTGQTCYYNSSTTADCTVGEWKTTSEWDKSVVAEPKIGLMYASDYTLSLGESVLDYRVNSYYSTLKTGWMHLSNNDTAALSTTETAPPSSYEWTMSRYGAHGSYYYAWSVGSNGNVSDWIVYNAISVRPVFYLESDVGISGGDGSSSNPFIIG